MKYMSTLALVTLDNETPSQHVEYSADNLKQLQEVKEKEANRYEKLGYVVVNSPIIKRIEDG